MTWGRLAAPNHRGVPVPRILWVPVDVLALGWTAGHAAIRPLGWGAWGAVVGMLLVSAAGLVDDLSPIGPRGLRGHLRSLVAGRMTTGLLKALVSSGAAVVVVALQPSRPGWVELSGVVLVAASANVWNALDVRPGRALKAFLPVILVFLLAGDLGGFPGALGAFVAALLALPLDLREHAMLGDAGSNPLGFAAGLGLYLSLPDAGVPLGAAAAVGLNLLAETVSLTRSIEALPPLRWLDRLGRPEPSA